MKLEVLVSTMNQSDYKIISKMNIQSDVVIINQGATNSKEVIYNEKQHITWINSTDRGLSKSRNLALENSKADICILADDDLIYKTGYEQTIIEYFEQYPDIDIFAFCVSGIEGKFKNYSDKEMKINFIKSMKVSSVEIAFRSKSIKANGISFNELFGSGAKFYMGEENIFLSECLRKGLKIKFIPAYIADLHLGNSTWFKGYDESYFISKGAAFSAMSPKYSYILFHQFLLRKYKLYSKEISFLTALKAMNRGRKEYIANSIT